jgi:hypothetical protein
MNDMKGIWSRLLCSGLFCIAASIGKANTISAPDTSGAKLADCKQCIVLAEQLYNRAAIADVNTQQIIWEWRPEQSNVKPAHLKWFTNTSDIKPVYNGKYLLVTASGGGVALVRIADKKTRHRSA